MGKDIFMQLQKNQAVIRNKQIEMKQLQTLIADCPDTESGEELKQTIIQQAEGVMSDYKEAQSIVEKVIETIKTLTNEDMKQVLMFRYIDNMQWDEISERLCFSKQWCRSLHNKALHLLEGV